MPVGTPEPASGPVASVVVPAHDEASVIARCLAVLTDGAGPGELEIVVVANGCSDDTADVARRAAPDATVLDLPAPGKVGALEAGDGAATVFPRVYLDADVEMDAASVRAVAEALAAPGIECAGPRMVVDLDGSPWVVRRFWRAFQRRPYHSEGLVGNGVYALSAAGRARFDRWPAITGDDLFVRNLFTDEERASVHDAVFVSHAPRSLRGLLATRERAYRGNDEYRASGLPDRSGATLQPSSLLSEFRHHPIDTAVFVTVNAVAKLRLRVRRREVRWERDASTR